ncbi:MAG: dockerin type I domain-containing protein [Phycisphaerae bacterium]
MHRTATSPIRPRPPDPRASPPEPQASARAASRALALLPLIACAAAADAGPFAAVLVDYAPAPGQFVNDAAFADPLVALGAPAGGGTDTANNTSVVTLGGFGGSITLAFDHVVADDPLNPFGLDAIVFGNAFWAGNDPARHWGECATIEIAFDANGDGLIDDSEGWYLIPGSHLPEPASALTEQLWDDDPDTAIPPAAPAWIPAGDQGLWATVGFLLPDDLFGPIVVENPGAAEGFEAILGYADYTPTLVLGDFDADNVADDPLVLAEEFYVVPDDPLRIGITPGSGGGDGFDIAWAVDPATGMPVNLPGFDFIRITNAVNRVNGPFGEKSPEIDAVADVAVDSFGDCDSDADIDLLDVACVQNCTGATEVTWDAVCAALDRNSDGAVTPTDAAAAMQRVIGPQP